MFTQAALRRLLNAVRGTTFTFPTSLTFAAFLANDTEVSSDGTNYARASVTFNAAETDNLAEVIKVAANVEFNEPSASWGEVAYLQLIDDESFVWAKLTLPEPVLVQPSDEETVGSVLRVKAGTYIGLQEEA